MTSMSPNKPYNPYERGLPATTNSVIWDKQGAPVAPTQSPVSAPVSGVIQPPGYKPRHMGAPDSSFGGGQ